MPALEVSDDVLTACRRGDRVAFGQLFETCRDRVYAIAYGVCGNHTVAADVCQEVFVKLLTRLPQFSGRSAFATWLYRVVVNAAIDHQRASRRLVAIPERLPDPERLEETYARHERRARVERAVQLLPSKLRAPLVLRHVEGLSYGEIARVLDLSPGTVASRLARAHARLARTLEGEP